jgi:hypothetical protein
MNSDAESWWTSKFEQTPWKKYIVGNKSPLALSDEYFRFFTAAFLNKLHTQSRKLVDNLCFHTKEKHES